MKPAASRMSAQDVKAITAYHNKVRADVGVGPLQWSPALANYAQEWADHLASTKCGMEHRTDGLYGENLFQATAGAYTAVDGAKTWESEKKDYHGGVLTRSNWQAVGHYTQMVWRDTRMLGCGEAVCAGSSSCAGLTCKPLPASCNGQVNFDCDDFPEDCDEPCCPCSNCP